MDNNNNDITTNITNASKILLITNLKPSCWRRLYDIYKGIRLKQEQEREDDTQNPTCAKNAQVQIILNALRDFYEFDIALKETQTLASYLVDVFSRAFQAEKQTHYITISSYDYKMLKQYFALHKEQNIILKKLLISFAVYASYDPYPTNWIKYDRRTIFFLAGLEKKKSSEQEAYVRQLHTDYGLELQVVGSTQPIPCFKLPWYVNQTPEQQEESNTEASREEIVLGDFSQETIHLIAMAL